MREIVIDTIVAVLIIAAMVLFLFAAIPAHYPQSQGGDYPYYEDMARSLLDNGAPSPWRYRLLNPLFASWLIAAGMSANAAFLTLTAIFSVASCVLMRVYLGQLGLPLAAARAGALLFAVSVGAFIPLRRYYGYTDALTNCLILLVLVLTAARRHVAVSLALGVGTVAKESMLLLLPFLAHRLKAARASWRHALLVLLPPVAVFAALRLFVPAHPSGNDPVALTWDAQVEYWRTAMVNGPVRWLLWAFAYSMGPVWLLALAGARRNLSFIASMSLYALPVLVPLTRTTDTERALMLLFPIVFPLAAHSCVGCNRRGVVVFAVIASACTWIAQLTFDWVPQLRLGPVNAKDIAFLVLCVVPLVVLVRYRSSRSTAQPLAWPDDGVGRA